MDVLTIALIVAPCAALGGISISKTQRYRPQLWVAWCTFILGMGLFTTIRADRPTSVSIGLSVILAMSSGILYCECFKKRSLGILVTSSFLSAGVYFPVLSPLPVSANALALSFHGFCRSFAGVRYLKSPCGVTETISRYGEYLLALQSCKINLQAICRRISSNKCSGRPVTDLIPQASTLLIPSFHLFAPFQNRSSSKCAWLSVMHYR